MALCCAHLARLNSPKTVLKYVLKSTLKFSQTLTIPPILLLLSTPAHAELLIDPVAPIKAEQGALDISYTNSKINYRIRSEREFKRKIFGIAGQYGIKHNITAFAQIGLIQDLDYENVSEKGKGTMFGAGVRGVFYTKGALQLNGYGLANFTNETIDDIRFGILTINLKFNIMELEAGVIGNYNINGEFSAYGGISLVPYSDGEAKSTGNIGYYSGSYKHSMERDNMLSLHGGAQFAVNQEFVIHAGIAFIGETTFSAGGLYRF